MRNAQGNDRARRRPAGLALLAGLLIAGAAGPADAQSRHGSRHHHRGDASSHVVCGIDACTPASPCRHARREYRRGADRGARDGYAAGFSDARYGRSYWDSPTRRLRHVSPHFVEGYLTAFTASYARGYDRGGVRRHRRWRRGWWR